MPKKISPNFEDANRIKEWMEKGKSAGQISDLLLIDEKAVALYMSQVEDGTADKPRPKVKPKDKLS